MKFVNAPIDKIAIENPTGIINTVYRKPDQIIDPYYFGDSDKKRTCLWLKELPHLWYAMQNTMFEVATAAPVPEPMYRRRSDGKAIHFSEGKHGGHERSRTFPRHRKRNGRTMGRLAMSLAILEAIGSKTAEIPSNLKPALRGAVTPALTNYFEITGQRKNKKFLYREVTPDDDRATMLQRTAQVYFSIGFARQLSGDLMDAEFQSWSELRRMLQGDAVVGVNMWQLQETTDALLNALRASIISSNRVECRFLLIQMKKNIDAMIRGCEFMNGDGLLIK